MPVLVNGKSSNSIDVTDRGLQYGDGLFETMAIQQKAIRLWDLHWQRLQQGCERLRLELPERALIEKEIAQLMALQDESAAVLKLVITRGNGERGYAIPKNTQPNRILLLLPWKDYAAEYYTQGVDVRYCDTRLAEQPQLAGIKHLNRLPQVLARNEWQDDCFQEGLMLDSAGHVVDGTMSNVFAIKDGRLFTPQLDRAGVKGVMREKVIQLAKQLGIDAYESVFTPVELEMADELFLTNALIGIWPVRCIGKTRFTRVGDITRQLQEELVKSFRL